MKVLHSATKVLSPRKRKGRRDFVVIEPVNEVLTASVQLDDIASINIPVAVRKLKPIKEAVVSGLVSLERRRLDAASAKPPWYPRTTPAPKPPCTPDLPAKFHDVLRGA